MLADRPHASIADCLSPIAPEAPASEVATLCALRAQGTGHAVTVFLQHHNHTAAVRQFLNAELLFNAAVCDDFTKSLFGFSPGLEALPPLGGWHDARRYFF